MKIGQAYKGIPIGFSDGVTRTNQGIIYDAFYIGFDYARDNKETYTSIGRIGKWNDTYMGTDVYRYVATPLTWSPFHNRARSFSTRKEAAIWLLGVYESQQPWMREHIDNPKCAQCNSTHTNGSCSLRTT